MKFLVRDRKELQPVYALLSEWDESNPLRIEVREGRKEKTLSQLALFWLWCREIGQKIRYSADDTHDLLCHRFLGYYTLDIDGNHIRQLRTITRPQPLDVGDMHHFMNQIDRWSIEHGIYLTTPADSEYSILAGMRE
jgi:hypothetical protein